MYCPNCEEEVKGKRVDQFIVCEICNTIICKVYSIQEKSRIYELIGFILMVVTLTLQLTLLVIDGDIWAKWGYLVIALSMVFIVINNPTRLPKLAKFANLGVFVIYLLLFFSEVLL